MIILVALPRRERDVDRAAFRVDDGAGAWLKNLLANGPEHCIGPPSPPDAL